MEHLHHATPVAGTPCRVVGLPPETTFDELLGTKVPVVKKGAMRRSAAGGPPAAGTSRMGTTKKVTARHLGDGKELPMEMQVTRGTTTGAVLRKVAVKPCLCCDLQCVCGDWLNKWHAADTISPNGTCGQFQFSAGTPPAVAAAIVS